MFEHIRKLAVDPSATSTYTFYQIHGRPTLKVRPSGEINPRYMDAMFKCSKGIARRIRSGEMSVDLLEETRDIDLKLYPKYVVQGWEEKTVLTDKDEPALFTGENCEKFLTALPPDMYDDLRAYCGDLSNFRGEDSLRDEDVEAISGN